MITAALLGILAQCPCFYLRAFMPKENMEILANMNGNVAGPGFKI